MNLFGQTRKGKTAQWHCIHLDAAQLAAREHERMIMTFNRAYMAAHRPYDANLWINFEGDGSADVYLSPRSVPVMADLINRYQACTCDPPAGDPECIAGHGYRSLASKARMIYPHTTGHSRPQILPGAARCPPHEEVTSSTTPL